MSIDPSQFTGTLTENDFTIAQTRFVIDKLPAMRAYDLLEAIRYEVGTTDQQGTIEWRADTLIGLILGLKPAFVKQVRDKLFAAVHFTNENAQTPQPLLGAEDTAFKGLEPVSVYEVLTRCLAVNFMPSLHVIISKLPSEIRDSSLSSQPESPPSSAG